MALRMKPETTTRFAGISDEAGTDLCRQLRAQAELGWSQMELRYLNGTHVCDLDEDEWVKALEAITNAGQRIIGFAGRCGDPRHHVGMPFAGDLEELRRALPRMKACGAKLFRCMSIPNSKDNLWPEAAWRTEVIRRLRTLAEAAGDAGVLLAHENCSGYGARSPRHCMELVEEINHPAFGLILDTGNPGHSPGGLSAWEWYQGMKGSIVHVHVKDYQTRPGERATMCMPGEGDSGLDRIFADLKQQGYQGVLSIEPHLFVRKPVDEETHTSAYIEHGRKAMALWESC